MFVRSRRSNTVTMIEWHMKCHLTKVSASRCRHCHSSHGAVSLSRSECRRLTPPQCAGRRQCRCRVPPPTQTRPWLASPPCQVSVVAAGQARLTGSWNQSTATRQVHHQHKLYDVWLHQSAAYTDTQVTMQQHITFELHLLVFHIN